MSLALTCILSSVFSHLLSPRTNNPASHQEKHSLGPERACLVLEVASGRRASQVSTLPYLMDRAACWQSKQNQLYSASHSLPSWRPCAASPVLPGRRLLLERKYAKVSAAKTEIGNYATERGLRGPVKVDCTRAFQRCNARTHSSSYTTKLNVLSYIEEWLIFVLHFSRTEAVASDGVSCL
ncbi:hypothetical protein BDP67DRAFT_504031 [Colletotrichum lupini]|nr:hypothetical protein BDP67DRAFT_504031 [Colletotrichum lupini]